MITYRIPLTGIKQSTNKIYAGIHWSKRKELKDSILSYAVGFCRPIQKPKSYPVQICYRFFFVSRALDTLNCAYMAKAFEDAFRAIGIIEEDDPKHVASSVLEVIALPKQKGSSEYRNLGTQKIKENEDYVEITIKSIN